MYPSTENASFPASNIQDTRRTKVFRSTSGSDEIIFDFQESSEVDSFVIVDEPRNGFGLSTIDLEFSGTGNFSSPAFSTSLSFSTVHGVGVNEFAEQDYRFARLVMTSSLGYCELSKIFIGKELDLGRCQSYGWSYQDKEIVNTKENRYGQKFSDIITRQRVFNLRFELLDKDHLDKIFQIYDNNGTTKPFFVSMDCGDIINDTNRFAGMVFMNSIPAITNTSFGRYSLSMQLEEAM
jgi:hypothetical protein